LQEDIDGNSAKYYGIDEMSKNIELVKSLIECFNQGNADNLASILTADVKHSAAGTAFNAEIEGRDVFLDYIRDDVLAKFNSINFDAYNISEDREKNTVTAEWRGEFNLKNGKSFSSKGVFVVDIKDGKIDWVRDYFDTEKTKQATS
jgi:ketosteroid isomerase-like protein